MHSQANDQTHHQRALATDAGRLDSLFGRDDLLPLWIAEPYVALSSDIRSAIEARAADGWYGYESRPEQVVGEFWDWMGERHDWDGSGLQTSVSPSVGTSIGAMIDLVTDPGDGVILQPPVFTDFKPLIASAERRVVRNSLVLEDGIYRMDVDGLVEAAADPRTRMMILCNPHNPVGRLWTRDELRAVAEVCAASEVVVVADEIHADLALGGRRFVPFAAAAEGTGVRWVSTHGPIKTFGLAGVCDTLIVTEDSELTDRYRKLSSRLHLTRNNVFGLAAFETAYRMGGPWVDSLLELVETNMAALRDGLEEDIELIAPEATYLAWLDFRELGLDVPDLARWLAAAGLALSPGHWFGREGAGFARMTVAVGESQIAEAIDRLNQAERP